MKIYLSTWLVRDQGSSLTKKRAKHRLLSYHFLVEQEISNSLLEKYYETGRHHPSKNDN